MISSFILNPSIKQLSKTPHSPNLNRSSFLRSSSIKLRTPEYRLAQIPGGFSIKEKRRKEVSFSVQDPLVYSKITHKTA
jgi:hypothetical protein